MTRSTRAVGLGLALALGATASHADDRGARSSAAMTRGTLVPFKTAPYPYDGMVPTESGPGVPFLRQDEDNRLFHQSPRGGKLFADTTYSDNRSLIYIPKSFAIARPGAIILFLHGNLATLEDVRGRQRVTRQLADSHLNAVLVAPQLAVKALDSSPGHFYERGFFQNYMREAAEHLAAEADGRFDASQIDALPIIIVAYSGGYLATAFALHHAPAEGSRIKGVILLDALFGEEGKFKDWIEERHATTFFVSAYSDASSGLNAHLLATLRGDGIPILDTVPASLEPGDIVFQAAPGAVHNDFVTNAWVRDPLGLLLARIRLGATGHGADGPR